MPADLDLRDLEEVRRRVAIPVVTSLVRPDELEAVEVEIISTPHRPRPDILREMLEVRVRACGEVLIPGPHWFVTDALCDTEWLAAEMYGAVHDEVVVSAFAWGELREGDYEILPPSGVR